MAKQIPKKIMNILNETRKCLDVVYAQQTKEPILFGSYAEVILKPAPISTFYYCWIILMILIPSEHAICRRSANYR